MIFDALAAEVPELLAGEIEVDESYFGGHRKGKHGRGAADTVPVFGLLKRQGKVYVAGGRLSVRCALYMATLPAIRFNPTIRAFYQHLRADGKAPKVAITAAFAQVLETADHAGQPLTAEELAAFRKAVEAIEHDAAAARVDGAASDAALAKSLGTVGDASFGIGSSLAKAVSAVTDRIRNTASTVAFGSVRDFISPAVGLFLGDVFFYLQQGGLRDRIQESVRADLVRAHEASKGGGGPVVVIGHSMGGVILADKLQDLDAAGLPADLKVAALFTVGSQPGLFKSVGLLAGAAGPEGLTPRPPCVAAWFNVFDPIDPLAFRADPLYSGVEDLVFDSITGLASAHTTSFSRPQFHARFRKRLSGLEII